MNLQGTMMTDVSLSRRLEEARRLLAAAGQEHVLHFVDDLDEPQRRQLLDQVEEVDWPELAKLVVSHVLSTPESG